MGETSPYARLPDGTHRFTIPVLILIARSRSAILETYVTVFWFCFVRLPTELLQQTKKSHTLQLTNSIINTQAEMSFYGAARSARGGVSCVFTHSHSTRKKFHMTRRNTSSTSNMNTKTLPVACRYAPSPDSQLAETKTTPGRHEPNLDVRRQLDAPAQTQRKVAGNGGIVIHGAK